MNYRQKVIYYELSLIKVSKYEFHSRKYTKNKFGFIQGVYNDSI